VLTWLLKNSEGLKISALDIFCFRNIISRVSYWKYSKNKKWNTMITTPGHTIGGLFLKHHSWILWIFIIKKYVLCEFATRIRTTKWTNKLDDHVVFREICERYLIFISSTQFINWFFKGISSQLYLLLMFSINS